MTESNYLCYLWELVALTPLFLFHISNGLPEIHNDLDQFFFCVLFVLGCFFHTPLYHLFLTF